MLSKLDKQNALLIDFETRSQVDLIKAGMAAYAEDRSTTVLCLGWELDGKTGLWKPGDKFPEAVATAISKVEPALGWNVGFEWYIWNYVLIHMADVPTLSIDQCHDIAAWARAMSFPAALDKACHAMRLPVQKDMEGRRIMLRLCKPIPPKKGQDPDKIYYDNDPEKLEKLYKYCGRDIKAERKAAMMLKPLSEAEERVWRLDFVINHRGVRLDQELVGASQLMVKKAQWRLNKDIKRTTHGALSATTQVTKLLDWSNERLELAELPLLTSCTKEELEDYLLEHDNIPEAVATALDLRLQGAKASTAKLSAMLKAVSSDGKLRGMLMYHAASPGRWGGRRVQVHNFPRQSLKHSEITLIIELILSLDIESLELLFGAPMHSISQALRGMMIASEGKELIVADYNAIECRMLAWIANEENLLNLFANDQDPYVDMASKIPGADRFLGKTTILGCGYQMAAERFKRTCKAQGRLIDLPLAEDAVGIYRSENAAIVAFWYKIERAAFLAFANPRRWVKIVPGLKIQVRQDYMWIRLPSRRLLCYAFPDIQDTKRPWGEVLPSVTYESWVSQTKKWERVPTYGGKLTENVCQAMARDIMVEGMFNVEKRGYEIIFTVHDELVTERDRGKGHLAEFLHGITTVPDWAGGLPIKAEGWIGDRYRKG